MPYIIKHLEVRLTDFGTLQEPHLYHIASGQRNNASLLFHVKIAAVFHTLSIAKVNKKSINMECVDEGWRAHHKFQIDEKFVKCAADFYKCKSGKTRPKFYLDFSDPELRDVTNWTVKTQDSKPHKEHEKADFFTHIQKEFREDHTSLALEEALLELVREFSDLPFLQQFDDPPVDEPTVIKYCKKFARVNRHLNFPPNFNEENDNADIDLNQTSVPNFKQIKI